MKRTIVFLVGPTAAGKTGLALSLARRIGARVISCDSMQVYKGMTILSSAPSAHDMKRVRHYLVGVIPPVEDFNVSRYRLRAMKAVRETVAARKLPLFVGGSGLYMSVVVDGIFKSHPEDRKVRDRLARQAQLEGAGRLHARLAEVDPLAASRIHPNDARRIIRALEVYEVSGRPISELQQRRRGLWETYDIRIFCLDLPRAELYRRIDSRVDQMFEAGIVDEVKALLKKRLGRTARCAIGINEVKGYLGGQYGLEKAKDMMKRNTRLYAKRQLTWFRKDKRIVWIDANDPKRAEQRIMRSLRGA